jgi:hypothetical protein
MAIEFDSQVWQQEARKPRESRGIVRPDWHSLQARLLAARDAGRAFAQNGSTDRSGNSGSFDRPAARCISVFGMDSAFVNPNDSADRNAGVVNEAFVADEVESGDRG